MRKNRFFIGALLVAALFFFGCGGGGGNPDVIVIDGGGDNSDITTHITKLDISKGQFYSSNGSTWDPQTGTIDLKMGGESWIRWERIPVTLGKLNRIFISGYSMPVSNVTVWFRNAENVPSDYGKSVIELYGDIIIEKIPLKDEEGIAGLGIAFNPESPGIYQLERIEITEME